jgi:hypothetical protein
LSNFDPIDAVERLSAHFTADTITLAEFANQFLIYALDATPDQAATCLSIAPESGLPAIHCLLLRFAQNDYFSYHDGLGSDPIEKRRRMQPHYRNVGNRLLEILAGTEVLDFDSLNIYKLKS